MEPAVEDPAAEMIAVSPREEHLGYRQPAAAA